MLPRRSGAARCPENDARAVPVRYISLTSEPVLRTVSCTGPIDKFPTSRRQIPITTPGRYRSRFAI